MEGEGGAVISKSWSNAMMGRRGSVREQTVKPRARGKRRI